MTKTKRQEFSKKTKALAHDRANGICEAEGCDKPGEEYDHIEECWEGGDNSLGNCKLLCWDCHNEKTNHSKAIRAWGNHFKVVKGRPKSGKIKSRGFDKSGKRKYNWGSRKLQSRGFK